MQLYGSLTRLSSLAFRQNSNDVFLDSNTGTTYTATRTWQLPAGDASGVISSNPMTTAGDIVYGGAAGVELRLAAGASGMTLHSGTVPSWAYIDLAAEVSGVLPPTNGGTGVSNNMASTLTISGAFATTLTVTATTSVTLPTTGTLLQASFGNVTGTLPIANGGTGQTSAVAAFDALAPTTTTGDTIYHNGTDNVRLPIGTTNQVLTVVAGVPAWAAPGANSFKYTWVTADTATVAITHSLGTTDITVEVFDIATGATLIVDSVVRTSTTVLTLTASEAPPATSWRVLIEAI